jgi:hypothetical protein
MISPAPDRITASRRERAQDIFTGFFIKRPLLEVKEWRKENLAFGDPFINDVLVKSPDLTDPK